MNRRLPGIAVTLPLAPCCTCVSSAPPLRVALLTPLSGPMGLQSAIGRNIRFVTPAGVERRTCIERRHWQAHCPQPRQGRPVTQLRSAQSRDDQFEMPYPVFPFRRAYRHADQRTGGVTAQTVRDTEGLSHQSGLCLGPVRQPRRKAIFRHPAPEHCHCR